MIIEILKFLPILSILKSPTVSSFLTSHDNQAWIAAYKTCPMETPPTIINCDDIPSDFPLGTYYRNGHARFESDDGERAYHMLDGDGMVSAYTIDNAHKTVLFRNRFVGTSGYKADKKRGVMSKPGMFGTKASGGILNNMFRTDFKNVGNTHVLYQNDKLYGKIILVIISLLILTSAALWEGGLPWILDPLTLECRNSKEERNGHTLDGILKKNDRFAAHYRSDPNNPNHICGFSYGLDVANDQTKVNLYELDQNMNLKYDEISFLFKGPAIVHDFCVTKNWFLFSIPPAKVDNILALKAMLGQEAFISAIGFENATESFIYMIPRSKNLDGNSKDMKPHEDDRIRVIKVPFHFSFHYANAFEEDGHVFLDAVCFDASPIIKCPTLRPFWEMDWDMMPKRRYVRFALDPEFETMAAGRPPFVISERGPEFPSIPKRLSGLRHRYVYTVGSHCEFDFRQGPPGSILKLDCDEPNNNEAYVLEPYEFAGEPIFIPKVNADVSKEEDKGYVICHVHDGKNLITELCIFDVEGKGSLEKGPVVRLRLPTFIPHGLHGTFVEGLTFDV